MRDRNLSWSANAFLVIIPMLNVLGGEKEKWISENEFKKRTAEKCEIMFMSTAFPNTRTDRSPIPSKVVHLELTEMCGYSTVQHWAGVPHCHKLLLMWVRLKKSFSSCFGWLSKGCYSSPGNLGMHKKYRCLQEY